MKVNIYKTIRTTDIAGTQVSNPEMEGVGETEDIVINLETGKIAYAALRYEGWFSRKRIAVLWSDFKEKRDENDRCLILTLSFDAKDTYRQRFSTIFCFALSVFCGFAFSAVSIDAACSQPSAVQFVSHRVRRFSGSTDARDFSARSMQVTPGSSAPAKGCLKLPQRMH